MQHWMLHVRRLVSHISSYGLEMRGKKYMSSKGASNWTAGIGAATGAKEGAAYWIRATGADWVGKSRSPHCVAPEDRAFMRGSLAQKLTVVAREFTASFSHTPPAVYKEPVANVSEKGRRVTDDEEEEEYIALVGLNISIFNVPGDMSSERALCHFFSRFFTTWRKNTKLTNTHATPTQHPRNTHATPTQHKQKD